MSWHKINLTDFLIQQMLTSFPPKRMNALPLAHMCSKDYGNIYVSQQLTLRSFQLTKPTGRQRSTDINLNLVNIYRPTDCL